MSRPKQPSRKLLIAMTVRMRLKGFSVMTSAPSALTGAAGTGAATAAGAEAAGAGAATTPLAKFSMSSAVISPLEPVPVEGALAPAATMAAAAGVRCVLLW